MAKVSKNKVAYNKELKRIKNFIRRAEKRGFLFPEDIIPKAPKRITAQSVSRLKKLNPDTLYRKAQYLDTETGELRRGEVGREIERSLAAKKGAETRRKKKEAEKAFWTGSQTPPTSGDGLEFGTEDDMNNIRFDNFLDQLFARLGTPIETVYVTEFGTTRRRAAHIAALAEQARKAILGAVDAQVSRYGKSEYGKMLQEHAMDISALIDLLLYASNATHVNTAYTGLYEIIIGATANEEEKRLISNLEEYEDSWTVN